MDEAYIQSVKLRDSFAARTRVFSLQEVAASAAGPADPEQLRPAFLADPRFIRIASPQPSAPERFLPERELFHRWAAINLNLARRQQFRATEKQALTKLSSLRYKGTWSAPPPEFLDYGRRLGLIADAGTPGFYAFPLAYILAQTPQLAAAFQAALVDFEDREKRETALRQTAADGIKNLIAQLSPRDGRILIAREGLPPHTRSITLRVLGRELGITKERIRQLESRLRRNWNNMAANGPALSAIWIGELLRRGGSLLVDAHAADTPYLRFLAATLGVPLTATPLPDRLLLGADAFIPLGPEQFPDIAARGDAQYVSQVLESGPLPHLSRTDLAQLAAVIARRQSQRLTKGDKAYLALRRIGRPAHVSAIARMYAEMFPEEAVGTDWSVQQALGSRPREVIWAGAKSFALKEWGYVLPRESICETIAMIVAERYAVTGQPVPVADVSAELRRYVHADADLSTLAFTARRCPGVRVHARGVYLPRTSGDGGDPEPESEGHPATSSG